MFDSSSSHNDLIRDQFTRQAVPFAEKPEHSRADVDRIVLDAAELNSRDRVLDVACGPGLLAAVLAPHVAHVSGIDLTPAMIEQAKKHAAERGVSNVDWRIGDAGALSFENGSFSAVITRYSFHHMVEPLGALREMARVCAPGGKVIVIDCFTKTTQQQAAYDRIERLRDPSHISALQLDQLRDLFPDAGLKLEREAEYRLEMELESLLGSSFPDPGDDQKVRELMARDIDLDETGFEPHRVGNEIHFSFPVVVLVGTKSS
jgi:SAM-dependent methyltransferase